MNFVVYVGLAFLLSAVITALMIPQIILISFKKRLFDVVDARKVHSGIVPRLGGLAFTPAIVLSMALLVGLHSLSVDMDSMPLAPESQMATLLCAIMFLYMVGVTDDLVGVGYRVKFLFQFVCAGLIVASGVYLNDLYGLFGVHELSEWVAYPLTVLLIVFIINAINLIDGIDGLSSGLSMVAFFFLGCLFVLRLDEVPAVVAAAALGTLAVFFYFNVFGKAENRRKIFMGDCGSLTIGLLLAVVSIRFCMNGVVGVRDISQPLVVSFSVLMIPCFDVLRVMLGRIRRHKSPFLPDKTHIHHKFLALGMSHRTAMCTILTIDVFFVLFNLILVRTADINVMLVTDVVLWVLLNIWISHLIRQKEKREENLAQMEKK